MKNYLFILLCAVTAYALSSCAVYRDTTPIVGYNSYGIKADVTAELDPTSIKDVTITMKRNYILWFIPLQRNKNKILLSSNHYPIGRPYSSIGELQGMALYKAKVNNNADLILDPQFEIEHHSYFFGFYRKNEVRLNAKTVNVKEIKVK